MYNIQIILTSIYNRIYNYFFIFFINFVKNQVFFQNKHSISLSLKNTVSGFCSNVWLFSQFKNLFFNLIKFLQCNCISKILGSIQYYFLMPSSAVSVLITSYFIITPPEAFFSNHRMSQISEQLCHFLHHLLLRPIPLRVLFSLSYFYILHMKVQPYHLRIYLQYYFLRCPCYFSSHTWKI